MALYKRRMSDGRRSPTWYYDFRIRGRRYKGCTDQHDKKKARQVEDEMKANVRLGRSINGEPEKLLPRFKEYAKRYMEAVGMLKLTAKDDKSIIERSLKPFFGHKRLNKIERADVERFRNERLAGKLSAGKGRSKIPAPATVQHELALLKHIFNVARYDGLLERNPVSGIRLPRYNNRRDRVISPAEYKQLLLAVSPRGKHLVPIIKLANETGMRMGEILSLGWSDVSFTRHMLRLRETKNGTTRDVPMSEEAEDALKEWGRKDSPYVFPSKDGKMRVSVVSRAFARLAKRAKVRNVRFHDFRHSFCTRMREQGADILILKEITGHKHLAMLMRYTHPSEASKLALVRGHQGEGSQHFPTRAISRGNAKEKRGS